MRYPIAVFLLTCTAGCAGPSQTWTTHQDPSGFTIRHPPGWVVETGAKGLIKVRSADRRKVRALGHPAPNRDRKGAGTPPRTATVRERAPRPEPRP